MTEGPDTKENRKNGRVDRAVIQDLADELLAYEANLAISAGMPPRDSEKSTGDKKQ